MIDYTGFLNLFTDDLSSATVESNSSAINSEIVTGYALVLATDTVILITPDPQPYNIPKDLLHKYFLSSGDKVTAKVIKSIGQYSLINIVKVNRQNEIPDGFAKHFDDIDGVHSAVMVPINGTEVNVGHTAMVIINQNEEVIKRIKETVAECGHNTIKIALGIDGRQEVLNYLLHNGYDYGYLTTQQQSLKQQLMITLISFFRAKELAEMGKNVILVVYNLEKLLQLFNNAITQSNELDNTKITPNAIRDFTNMIKSSKTIANGGSLTILGFFTASDKPDNKFLYNTFSHICDYVI
jgi:transcription termination factor Rho